MARLLLAKMEVTHISDGELESRASVFERRAVLSTVLVFIGLLLEVCIAVKHPPFDSWLEQWGSVVADALVAIGVLGELLFSRFAASCQSELQRRTKSELAESIRQAGEANERAAQADEKAAEANRETALLHAQLAPRTISKDQYEALHSLKGQVSAVNITSCGDFEAARFSEQIAQTLINAGIEARICTPRVGFGSWADIHVVIPHPIPDSCVEPISAALTGAGLFVRCWFRRDVPMGDLPADIPVIMVGVKRPPTGAVPSYPFTAPRNGSKTLAG